MTHPPSTGWVVRHHPELPCPRDRHRWLTTKVEVEGEGEAPVRAACQRCGLVFVHPGRLEKVAA